MKYITSILFCFLCILPVFAYGKKEARSLSSEYFEIANAYADLSNYDKAILFYQKAATDKTFSNASQYNMARMYGLKNDWETAAGILKKLATDAPENTLILRSYGYALASSGHTKQALEIYAQLAQKEPENPEAQLDYIRLLVFAKEYELARSEIEKAIQTFPTAEERNQFETILKQIDEETTSK
ncbi:MAG: tetratricopeptide repeat protein [Spirochaetaceae bacterium]|nr:tetratricopeptide repeat protein [Spirochaetaceae bacterium]